MNIVNDIKPVQNLQRLVKLMGFTEEIPLKSLLGSEGNLKIPSSTAIFNITPAKFCASKKLGLCNAAKNGARCYAYKAEYFRKQVLPYRIRQMKFWKNISAIEFAKQFLLICACKKTPFLRLRINEAGDFVTQKDVDKAEEVARILRLSGVKTYCYTSRSDLSYEKVKNLIISGSGFRKTGISGEFKIIRNKQDKPKGYGMCPCNCHICNRCSTKGKLTCILPH